jgi:hypothetical protein
MRSYVFLAVGIGIAVLGAFPVMSLLAAEPDPVKDGTVAVTEIPVEVQVAPVETTLPAAEPEPVEGLTSSVSKVLELRGSATEAGLSDIGASLPDAVARLLIDRNAVLVVPEPATP